MGQGTVPTSGSDSKSKIDWSYVNYGALQRNESFELHHADDEIHHSNRSRQAYRDLINRRSNERIINAEVAAALDYSKVNFRNLNLDNFADINTLPFDNIGATTSKLPWHKFDFSKFSSKTLESIDWSLVNYGQLFRNTHSARRY